MALTLKPNVVTEIPIGSLTPDPRQPRKNFNALSLDDLSETIHVIGIKVPLSVRIEGKKLFIVDGERRWRAAKIAKLKTVPCLLEKPADEFDVAATQLTTAVQREDLSPIDIAEFLADLQKREKKSTNELLAALAKRGMALVGPSMLGDIMRLVDLPEWAKALLRDGDFTPKHGAVVLEAATYPAVTARLKRLVQDALNFSGGITIKEMRAKLAAAFRMEGTDLNLRNGQDDKDSRLFPIDGCRKCEFYKKNDGREWCLNRKHFDKLQSEALLLKSQEEAKRRERARLSKKDPAAGPETDPTKVEPRKLKVTPENIVILKRMDRIDFESLSRPAFDIESCKGCGHRRVASYDGSNNPHGEEAEETCFFPPCFHAKEETARKSAGRSAKLQEYLDAWLKPVLLREAKLRMIPNFQQALLVWLATGAVDERTQYYSGQMHQAAARRTESLLAKYRWFNLPMLMTDALPWSGAPPEALIEDLVEAAIEVMLPDQRRWLAQQLAINLDEESTRYRIDEGYLRMKRKPELGEIARIGGLESMADLSAEEVRAWLLENREKIGVPADVRLAYLEPYVPDPGRDEKVMADALDNEGDDNE